MVAPSSCIGLYTSSLLTYQICLQRWLLDTHRAVTRDRHQFPAVEIRLVCPPPQHALAVEREPVFIAPGPGRGPRILTAWFDFPYLIDPQRCARRGGRRQLARPKLQFDLLLSRPILGRLEIPGFLSHNECTVDHYQRQTDSQE